MKKRALFFLLLLLGCFLFSSSIQAEKTAAPLSLFLKANESYQKGEYETARDLYSGILQEGIRNGSLYYNLGNTYFRLGKIGKAIQNYLRAQELIPREEDLEANLRYAREETKDRIEADTSESVLGEIFFWYHRLSLAEMATIFLVCNLIFWGACTIRLLFKRPFLYWTIALSLLLGLTLGGTAAVRIVWTGMHKPAVVIVPEAPARSGMDPESTTLFVLHDGAEGVIDQFRNDWVLFRLPSGKKGWLKRAEVGLAVP